MSENHFVLDLNKSATKAGYSDQLLDFILKAVVGAGPCLVEQEDARLRIDKVEPSSCTQESSGSPDERWIQRHANRQGLAEGTAHDVPGRVLLRELDHLDSVPVNMITQWDVDSKRTVAVNQHGNAGNIESRNSSAAAVHGVRATDSDSREWQARAEQPLHHIGHYAALPFLRL